MANSETVNQQLAQSVKELREVNQRVAHAQTDMAKLATGVVGGSKAMAKEIIDKSGLAGLKNLPFAGLAASLGGKIFQQMKQKRENRLLEMQLGLAKGSAKTMRAEFELKEAQKAQLEALRGAAEKLGMAGDQLPVKLEKGIGVREDGDTTAGGLSAAEVEKSREEARISKKTNKLLQKVADNTKEMLKSFMGAVAKGGGMGLGALAGLIAAPVIIIVNFFKTLKGELKLLNKLTGGGLAKIFRPFIRFFDAVGDITKKGGTGKFLKKDTGKIFGRFTKMISNVVGRVRGVFLGIINFGRRIVGVFSKFSAFSGGFAKTFQGIARFARVFGQVLGKIFLPITILMAVFDGVTGFLDGFKESDGDSLLTKVIDGIGEGLGKIVGNLIGFPLNLLKDGVAWIGTKLGFDMSFMSDFDFVAFIKDIISFPFNMLSNAIDWIGTLFTDPVQALTDLWNGLVGDGGLIDMIFAPIDKAIAWVKGLFGWSTEGEEEFSIATFVKGIFNSVKEWFMGIFSWGKDAGTNAAGDFSFFTLIGSVFTSIKEWFMGLFAWGKETGTNAAGDFSFFTLIGGVFESVKTWFKGLFTFGDPNEDGSFSLGTLLYDTAKGIFDWFKGLFDIDIGGLIKSIPGAGKVLSWFGFGDEEPPEESPAADPNQQKLSENQDNLDKNAMEMEEVSKRMDKFESGKNAYFGRDTQAKYDADRMLFEQLLQREGELERANLALQEAIADNMNSGGTTVIDNSQRTSNQTSGGRMALPIPISNNQAWEAYGY